jgi:hypothetical protein
VINGVNLDLPTELSSVLDSIKSGVQTGVQSAVNAGPNLQIAADAMNHISVPRIRLSLEPFPGDPSYIQWKEAMKMVARRSDGVPTDFRKKVKKS